MNTQGLTGTYKRTKHEVEFGLMLRSWLDADSGFYFVYAPALDLTGYGETPELAEKSFDHTLKEFAKYTHTKDTIFDELEHLGWMVNRRKKRVLAPDIDSLLKENDTFRALNSQINVKDFQRSFDLQIA